MSNWLEIIVSPLLIVYLLSKRISTLLIGLIQHRCMVTAYGDVLGICASKLLLGIEQAPYLVRIDGFAIPTAA